MFVYGKMAANAVAIMSYLAAVPRRKAGSNEIAAARRLSPALTAKLLSNLATAGLVKGQPGPGGGYALNRPAKAITLFDIASIFESATIESVCPFGEGWCGNGDPCPLHDKIHSIHRHHTNFMQKTRLSVFAKRGAEQPIMPHLTALQRRYATKAAARSEV